jgi:hypothetical protein
MEQEYSHKLATSSDGVPHESNHNFPSFILKHHFNIALHLQLVLTMGLLNLKIFQQNGARSFHLSHTCYIPHLPHHH